jgi:PAS domain S-box-containing protein
MEQIAINTRTTVLLCLVALIASVMIGILTARWITQPIVSVSRSAKALADGEWKHTVEIDRAGDLGELASSFNQMADQIRTDFAAMQSLNKALSESESKTKQFLEAVPVGIGVVDATGRPCYANQQAIQLLGKGIDPTATPDQLAEVYQLYLEGTDQPYPIENLPVMRALHGECIRIDDLEIRQPNVTIPVEGWGMPIFDEQGNIVYAISAFQDITDRKEAEAALRESEARYRLLFESNPNPMWIYNAQTLAFLMVNDAAIQYYGYSLDEFLAMSILDIRPSADASRLLNHMVQVENISHTHSGEWQHRKRDGTLIDVEITSRAIVWSGIAARCVLVKDITERKRTERLLADYNQTLEQQVAERTLLLSQEIEERQQAEAALRRSEEQRNLTMDFARVGSWDWNIVENITTWNDNHARLLGLVPSEGENNHQRWRDRVHPEDVDRVEQAITAALATHTDYQTEYRVIYPDGSIHWVSDRGRGIYNTAGQPVRMLGVILDVSEQRNAALRERQRAEEASILEERNRIAREIHDTLAQAFTSIIVHSDAASQRLTLDPEASQSHLKTVRTLARSGLADARRSVEALRPQILEEGDLYSALDRLAAQMFAHTPVQIVCEAIGEPYPLAREVETNLLRIGQEALMNAFKYANASEIRVELRYEALQCILQIKDNGKGFESSITLGRGFGLLGMTERAERIGAELAIQSQPRQGTTVLVRVPTL